MLSPAARVVSFWIGAALSCGAGLALAPGIATAHVREPEVLAVAFPPDDPARVIAVTSFGLLRSPDAGATWDWICAPAYQADELDNPALVLAPDDVVLLGLFEGLLRGADGGCTWTQPEPALSATIVADLEPEPGPAGQVLALRRTALGTPDELWRTTDGGATWTLLAADLPPTLLLRDLHFAPSRPQRIYASATRPASAEQPVATAFLLASDDAGLTWSALELAVLEGEVGVEVFAVDPLREDRVYLGTRVADGDIEHPERLLVYEHVSGELRSALSLARLDAAVSDGTTLWVGGQRGAGLWRSTNDAESFDHVAGAAAFDVRCLALHPDDGALWLCGKPLRESFGLARSTDGGDTLEPVFVRADLERREACPADSATTAVCGGQWADLVADLQLDPALLESPDGDDTAGDTSDAGDLAPDTRVEDTATTADTAPDATVDGDDAADTGAPLEPSEGAGSDGGCCRAVVPAAPAGRAPLALMLALGGLGLLLRRRRG